MKENKFTLAGLFIAYCSIPAITQFFKAGYGQGLGDGPVLLREILIFAMVGVLLWLVKRKEKQSLDSIGLGAQTWQKTALWSFVTLLCCLAGIVLALGLIQALGWRFGQSDPAVQRSLWTTTLVMLRAGVAEEIFYRGYIYERLNALTGRRWLAVAAALIPFALFHFSQGYAGMLMAFILGGILTAIYIRTKNLWANMIAHFSIDFIPNVLIPLLSGS